MIIKSFFLFVFIASEAKVVDDLKKLLCFEYLLSSESRLLGVFNAITLYTCYVMWEQNRIK